MQLLILISLLLMGYFIGGYIEKRHYASIIDRERKLLHLPVITGEWREQIEPHHEGLLFSSATVVASDYFKTFVSFLRNIFGGRMSAYESLLDRARREAILRVKEKANVWGAEKILNLRIQTSNINGTTKKGIPAVEILVYATAIRKRS